MKVAHPLACDLRYVRICDSGVIILRVCSFVEYLSSLCEIKYRLRKKDGIITL
jgi:hypothetical protein